MKNVTRACLVLLLLSAAPVSTAQVAFKNSLAPLGAVQSVTQSSASLRGGMTFRVFDVTFAVGTKVRVTAYITTDGKYEQFLVEPAV